MMRFNKLILLFLVFWISPGWADEPVIFCDASKGLELLNKDFYSADQITMILNACDKVSPDSSSVLLLHGLFARKEAQQSKHYEMAIYWLTKATMAALPHDYSAALELAATYEWANNPTKAGEIYQSILTQNPHNRAALLGQARIFRLEAQPTQAAFIYQNLLSKNQNDPDALNGMGWIKAGAKDLKSASDYFHQTLAIEPENQEATLALSKINATEQQQSATVIPSCDAVSGLNLLSQKNPPVKEIEAILAGCKHNKIDNTETQLLHGLLSRHQNQQTKNYTSALLWLEKASQSAKPGNVTPELELAVTYEWAGKPGKAELIYQKVLHQSPTNRASLLGMARIERVLNHWNKALTIYQQLLKANPKDVDALNGMGWIELANKEFKAATDFFESSLKLQPQNQEALQGLKQIKNKPIPTQIISLCDADQGLILLNQPNPPLAKIVRILNYCDKNTPNATASLLLHGLMARHLARNTNNYDLAIFWLQKAMQTAEPTDNGPAVELAVTYEWAGDPKKALFIYKRLLDKNPHNRSALLGEARVFRMQYFIPQSITIYDQLLKNNPDDVEALNGQAESLMANYQFKQSRALLTKALDIRPGNTESLAALQTLNKSTKYIFGISGGNYSVPPEVSNALNLYFYDNLNATDGLTVFATHNSKQIGESFFSGPTLLPNNSFLIGYQHRIPNKYGWSLNYDYRQHDDLPFENRALVTTNLYLSRNFEWFNGLRAGFSTPWQNQLLLSGLTLYTSLPVNISVTGFWAHQQIGGKSSSYSLDLSKEYASRLFYSFGPSYSPTLKNWEVHGKITLPTFTNQALIADVSHYFFNKSTFLNVGWQFYWA